MWGKIEDIYGTLRYVSVFRGVTVPFFGSRKPQPCVTTSPSTLPLRQIGLAGFSLLQRHSQNANLKEAVGIRILKQRNLRFYLKLTIHHHGASWGYLQLFATPCFPIWAVRPAGAQKSPPRSACVSRHLLDLQEISKGDSYWEKWKAIVY